MTVFTRLPGWDKRETPANWRNASLEPLSAAVAAVGSAWWCIRWALRRHVMIPELPFPSIQAALRSEHPRLADR